MIRNENEAKMVYNSKIEKIDVNLGYSLTTKKTDSGWLVFKWYSRNNFVDDVLERKVLLRNDHKIFENHSQNRRFLKLLMTADAIRRWGFKAQMFNPQLNFNRITNDEFTTSAPLLQNRCYAFGFY